MKIITTLGVAIGLSALAACGGAAEENADNMDANLVMPADNFDTMDANAANEMDVNLGNDANMTDGANADAAANNAAGNTGY
ncbi:hypothetical protein [Sphingomonas sp.]|uniref:hypothetical protein n=1 Tax=Sphingomonas sp. TaxID=28214 RepID=UPI0017D93122|nr:hypothetical protein [Sphingomonas sp.]MBA3510528.1 hypothetical protein [Sphingomonas sp.]